MALVKITAADRYFSLCVRERADYHCEHCGKKYQKGDTGLHCSHLWSRRHKSVRHHADNAFAHCFHCHLHLGSNPVLFSDWARRTLGDGRFEMLAERHRAAIKWSKALDAEIAAHYKQEHAAQVARREQGETGRIEFASFW